MSLDLDLECPCCGSSRASFSHTYNVSAMWHAVFPEAKEMVDIEGMTGEASIPRLAEAINQMIREPDRFEEMNPSNGWGSAESFMGFLWRLREAARKFPKGVWKASR